nr:probable glutathione S-transferase [Ipomoea batatas]
MTSLSLYCLETSLKSYFQFLPLIDMDKKNESIDMQNVIEKLDNKTFKVELLCKKHNFRGTKQVRTSGEEHERAVKDSLEMLKTIEEEALALALGGGKKFFGGDEIGMVDIAFGGIVHWLEAIEDVVGVKLLEPAECFPKLHAWMMNFKESPLIKENLPDKSEMFVYFKNLREKLV